MSYRARGPSRPDCPSLRAVQARHARYYELRAEGLSIWAAAEAAGYSASSASRLERWRIHDLKTRSES